MPHRTGNSIGGPPLFNALPTRWTEAMNCLDNKYRNPLPRLIAFMPEVALLVLDNCITRDGDVKDEDFTVS